ncbi:MAG: hypothetical protein JNL81_16625 [Hyphomonadaceae bacterium]|nr:hypothetical protein [Hyphomonadaceae bacterium]
MPVFDLVQRGGRGKGELFTFETRATREIDLAAAYHEVEADVPPDVTIKDGAFVAVTCKGSDESDKDVVAVTFRHLIPGPPGRPRQQIALMVGPVTPRAGNNHKLKFQVLVLQA